MSNLIGKPVMMPYGTSFRHGVVVNTREENGWTFVNCRWVDDEAFNHDVERVCSLRNLEREEEWNRVDKVRFISIGEQISKLAKLSVLTKSEDGNAQEYFLTQSNNFYAALT
jgi:hypothetical protein